METGQPGDVLYTPSWMWHWVENDAPTIGVGAASSISRVC